MTEIRSCIEHQISEIELLRCCYSSSEEFSLDDPEALSEAKDFLDGKLEFPSRNISFILKIPLNEPKTIIEFQFVYPFHYPTVPVDIHLRTYLSREGYEKFHDLVKQFLAEKISRDEPYLMEFLSWIQDHAELFLGNSTASKQTSINRKETVYSRLWIYSHHIFSTDKRRNIVHWAEQLNLNGFSLPGKPGIICVEGQDNDVEQYWTRLRNLNWKKLQIKEKEILPLIDSKVKLSFHRFEELSFVDDHSGKGDFGQFYHYLQEKQFEHIFHLYFGVDGTEKK